MKYLTGTQEYLTEVDQRINDALSEDVTKYSASQYSEIIPHEDGFALPIDEGDTRNPMQYLTDEERESLIEIVPVEEPKEELPIEGMHNVFNSN